MLPTITLTIKGADGNTIERTAEVLRTTQGVHKNTLLTPQNEVINILPTGTEKAATAHQIHQALHGHPAFPVPITHGEVLQASDEAYNEKEVVLRGHVPGETWEDLSQKNPSKALQLFIASRVASALDYATGTVQNQVVHRDLKPHNIIMTPEGQPVIIDWSNAYLPGKFYLTGLPTGDSNVPFSYPYASDHLIRKPDQPRPRDDISAIAYSALYTLGHKLPAEVFRKMIPQVFIRERHAFLLQQQRQSVGMDREVLSVLLSVAEETTRKKISLLGFAYELERLAHLYLSSEELRLYADTVEVTDTQIPGGMLGLQMTDVSTTDQRAYRKFRMPIMRRDILWGLMGLGVLTMKGDDAPRNQSKTRLLTNADFTGDATLSLHDQELRSFNLHIGDDEWSQFIVTNPLSDVEKQEERLGPHDQCLFRVSSDSSPTEAYLSYPRAQGASQDASIMLRQRNNAILLVYRESDGFETDIRPVIHEGRGVVFKKFKDGYRTDENADTTWQDMVNAPRLSSIVHDPIVLNEQLLLSAVEKIVARRLGREPTRRQVRHFLNHYRREFGVQRDGSEQLNVFERLQRK